MIADDRIAACPGGDSVNVFAPGHPKWLRVRIHYEDNDCNFKVGVPPESIWVTYAITQGNLKLNDKATKVFADDYTDEWGDTWITLKSFSGCGAIRCSLFVSGKFSGYKDRLVRTTDQNANGRTEQSEGATPCDLNYDEVLNDGSYRVPHYTDWHRNVLHGTPVQCTSPPTAIPFTDLSWSPSGRRLVFSVAGGGGRCVVKHVYTNPPDTTIITQFTWLPEADDYDASWSPLGDEIFFSRSDTWLYRKGVPGFSTDTSEVLLFTGDSRTICTSISPDGRTIAFSRLEGPSQAQRYTIWTIPATGGIARRITALSNYFDWYPRWSADGQTLVFDRRDVATGRRSAYTVPAFQDPPPDPTPFYDVVGTHATFPAYSADGAVVTAGVGAISSAATVHTLDAAAPAGFKPIQNYAGYTTANTFPRLSPDGTRLALFARPPAAPGAPTRVWAVRRNMNPPPSFAVVNGQSVADSTARFFVTMLEALPYSFTVEASDPADPVPDPLTYVAYYLQQGMTFVPATRTFSWTPPVGTAGQTFHVRFSVTTPSGGTDAIIAVISVALGMGPGSRENPSALKVSSVSDDDGLVSFEFQGALPKEVQLTVYDLAGRRIAQTAASRPEALRWDGRDESGTRVASGVYLYRVRSRSNTLYGKLVYLR